LLGARRTTDNKKRFELKQPAFNQLAAGWRRRKKVAGRGGAERSPWDLNGQAGSVNLPELPVWTVLNWGNALSQGPTRHSSQNPF
jgi:hypothetical protein